MSGIVKVTLNEADPLDTREGVLHCRTVVSGRFKQTNHVRQLAPIELEERFGSPDGVPVVTSSEALLVALGSCLGARIHANAASGNIQVHSLELEVEANVAPSTMWEPRGTEPGPAGFDAIRVAVHMDADASPEALRSLIAHALMWSPVANILHSPVHLDVALGRTDGVSRPAPS